MIDHPAIGVAGVARSAAFYDPALGALGRAGDVWMKLVNPEDAATLVPAPQRRQRASTTASRNLRDTAKGYPPGYYTVFLRARTRRQQELRLRVALAGLPALEIEDAVAPEQHRLAVDDEPALPVHARVDDPPKALV